MPSRSKEKDNRAQLILRLSLAGVVLLFWAAALCFRLWELQVERKTVLLAQKNQQQEAFIEITPHRGEILDRHLNTLAASAPVQTLFAHPPQVEDAGATALALAPILGVPPKSLLAKLTLDKPFVYLARRVSPQTAEQVTALRLQGVFSQSETRRFYPNQEIAGQLLGFVGDDGKGLSGLEYRWEEALRGKAERIDVRVDAHRRSFLRNQLRTANRGDTLVLHLDSDLQFIAEQVLQETAESSRAKSGSVVVLDPHSGQVLAMASYPSFDPNRYQDYTAETFRNRAVRQVYEPGSTFKIISLAAVLNENQVDLGEAIDCTVGTLRLGGKTYREASHHSYGSLNFNQIVAKSSNVGTIKLTLRLGNETLYDYIRRFGFGEKTGVGLPGEEVGILRPTAEWSKLSIGALAIGQEIGTTPLQVLSAVSAVANGGLLIRPQVVKEVRSPEGQVIFAPDPAPRRILSERTARLMREALQNVVQDGTGKLARLNGYSSAGKTGTAQKFVNGAYSKTLHVPSYVGFAPLHRPVLAAVVVLDEPRGRYYGGEVVAPAFAKLMQRSLKHLKAPKDLPENGPGAEERMRIAAAPRTTELPSPEVLSIDESASPTEAIPESSKIAVEEISQGVPYSDATEVDGDRIGDRQRVSAPDFAGMSLRGALRLARQMGFSLEAHGSGVAVRQSPQPGQYVPAGTRFEIYFSYSVKGKDAAQRIGSASTPGSRP